MAEQQAEERPGYNASVEVFRETEYPMLKDAVYLDHAGTTLYSKSLMEKFTQDMMSSLLGNPHSASPSSQLSTSRIEDIRLRALHFFNADPTEFDLIFVANATAGIKLVVDALRAGPEGFDYAYHEASHTSLVGGREEARNSLCLSTDDVVNWISGDEDPFETFDSSRPLLFAYPAQSNMDGSRYPVAWSNMARSRQSSSKQRTYTLLDAAAFVSTSPLDLGDSETAPDFTVMSFYKIFGFPDLGALIVRKQAAAVFDSRKYFGGGTVDMVVCVKEQWHAPKSRHLHERLEDGTLPFHSIIALDSALDVHRRLYGSMDIVAAHTSFLADRLYSGLEMLKHHNGRSVCVLYSSRTCESEAKLIGGPVVAFNIRNAQGAWITLAELEKLAILKQFHIRTGGVCNPGGIATALGLLPWEMKRNFSAGFRCGQDNELVAGKPTGIIRVSLGAMSTVSDVDQFVAFIKEFYQEEASAEPATSVTAHPNPQPSLHVARIVVFPIKSCGAFEISPGIPWEVRPEGLAWDREWCLLHRGSGQALSQKRYPKMALIRPSLDFNSGLLRVAFVGELPPDMPREISVSLSADPRVLDHESRLRSRASQVCGEDISAQTYTLDVVNDFFSAALGVPCILARFPPGGQGKSMRHAKAHMQWHQVPSAGSQTRLHGAFPAPPSPPESDEDSPARRILLSNESPILAIQMASVSALNREIVARGGSPVDASAFRANIIFDSSGSDVQAYIEDSWPSVRIGRQSFRMLGSCRRCHMVCIDQETAERGQEPFVTLSKTRRFDGKVFFGSHMAHDPKPGSSSREDQSPTISVGDPVEVEGHL